MLPTLEGPRTATSLPGEHLFQASALPRNRMRPAIFHAFGKAKVGAQAALRDLERQGWQTLPIAILGMPNLPPAWAVDTWKPIGGCKFTGFSSGTVGNSALRFCLTYFQARCTMTALAVVQGGRTMMTWSQLPRRRRTHLRTEQASSLRLSRVIRQIVVRLHAQAKLFPVHSFCHRHSLCPGARSQT